MPTPTLLSPPPLARLTPPPPRGPRRRRRAAARVVLGLVWLAVVVAATLAGLDLREWVWRETAPIRFRGDVTNAVRIGHRVNDDAVAAGLVRARAAMLAEGDAVGSTLLVPRNREVPPPFRGAHEQRVRAAMSKLAGTDADESGPLSAAPWSDVWAAYRAQYDWAFEDGVARRAPDADAPPDNAYSFDYPPGRLWVVTAWLREVRADPTIEPAPEFRRAYSDRAIGPMLRVNNWHEWFAAAGTFALARRVLRRGGRSNLRATSLATLAALLAWFNPALLLNAHGWPQWDCWVLPYVIWAVYFGVADRWLMSGALLAVGAMFKGQTMIVAPLLVMWPLFRLDFDAVARLAAGFIFAAAACLSPWLLRTTPAIAWLSGVGVFTLILAITALRFPRRNTQIRKSRGGDRTPQSRGFAPRASPDAQTHGFPRDDRSEAILGTEADAATDTRAAASHPSALHDTRMLWFLALAIAAVAWIAAPFAVPGTPASVWAMLLLAGFAVGAPAVWRGRVLPLVLATLGLGAFAAAARFDGSFAWLPVGFQTGRYPAMVMGRVANLPAVLTAYYGWQVDSPVPLFGTTFEMRSLLRGTFAAGLAILALGLARGTRRGGSTRLAHRIVAVGRPTDVNVLVALPAAWMLAYAVLPQMHERYLLWASVTSALLAARSVGGLLAHLSITAAQVAMILLSMIDSARMADTPPWSDWHRAFRGLQPSLGYAVALMACVLVVWATTRDERSRAR